MMYDFSLCQEDYYKAFTEMCDRYDNHSIIPYNFLDTLQRTLEIGNNKRYIDQSREQIKDYIHDGYVTVYRGEFASEKYNNLDYKESVSYSLNYNTAKHFATRFRECLELTKSIIYTVKVPIEDVVGFHHREDEVICIPIKIGGKMEVVKEESML